MDLLPFAYCRYVIVRDCSTSGWCTSDCSSFVTTTDGIWSRHYCKWRQNREKLVKNITWHNFLALPPPTWVETEQRYIREMYAMAWAADLQMALPPHVCFDVFRLLCLAPTITPTLTCYAMLLCLPPTSTLIGTGWFQSSCLLADAGSATWGRWQGLLPCACLLELSYSSCWPDTTSPSTIM